MQNALGSKPKKQENIVKKFFQLRIHGDDLVSTGTDSWMAAGKVAIGFMAAAEGLSWGYFASLFSGGNALFAVLSFIVFSCVMFMIVWSLDKSLITLDAYKRFYHEKTYIIDEDTAKKQAKLVRRFLNWAEKPANIGIRVLIVSLSMAFTAPYLVQLYFHKDIQIAIDKYAQQTIAEGRKVIDGKYNAVKTDLDEVLDTLYKQRYIEVGGKGITKKVGDTGPGTRDIDKKIGATQGRISENENKRLQELKDYDEAASLPPYEVLGKRWGISVPQNDRVTRSKVISPILESSDGSKATLTIRIFLILIFVVFILLKLLQPGGVKIYLSEALQQHYSEYKDGKLDFLLNKYDKYDPASPMKPYKFEEFMLIDYNRFITSLSTKTERNRIIHLLQQVENNIDTLKKEKLHIEVRISSELAQLRIEISNNLAESGNRIREIASLKNLIQKHTDRISTIDSDLQNLQSLLASIPSGSSGRQVAQGHYQEIDKLQQERLTVLTERTLSEQTLVMAKTALSAIEAEHNTKSAKIEAILKPISALEVIIDRWEKERVESIEHYLQKLVNELKK